MPSFCDFPTALDESSFLFFQLPIQVTEMLLLWSALACCCCLNLFYGFPLVVTVAADEVFASQGSASRHLLQAKKSCLADFEFLDYSILTNKCKGPTYSPAICCPAFKDLVCPYAEYLNDLTNDCALTIFSFINLYGKYPPGLFSSEWRKGKEGLACPASSPLPSANSTISASSPLHIVRNALMFPLLTTPSLLTVLRLNKVL